MSREVCYFSPPEDLSLLRGRLPLLGMAQLGDPFLLSAVTADPSNLRDVSDEEIRHELKRQYTQLPQSLAALGDFDYFYQQALTRRDDVAQKILQAERKNPIELTEQQRQQVCVARFFTHANALPLWETHAANHTGYVVVLDCTHRFFGGRTEKGLPQLFEAVQYRESRPFIGETQRFLAPVFFRAREFAQEAEWRLARPMDAGASPDSMSVRFPTAAIKRVIIGARMAQTQREKIRQLLANDLQLKKVPMLQAKVEHMRYAVVIEPSDTGESPDI